MATLIPPASTGVDRIRMIERPDGFYWEDGDGLEYGPFATLAAAAADVESRDAAESDDKVEEPLQEIERGIGMAGWIDPETGEPAEESVPRIEDH